MVWRRCPSAERNPVKSPGGHAAHFFERSGISVICLELMLIK
jgi:hypothetical protein